MNGDTRVETRSAGATLSHSEALLWDEERGHRSRAFLECPMNVTMSAWLNGRVDRDALASSVGAIVRRHQVLRSLFSDAGGEPGRRIADDAGVEWMTQHVGDLASGERERCVHRFIQAPFLAPFAASAGPLVRVRMLTLGVDRCLLSIVVHHIVFDGWSRHVFLDELRTLYAALAAGRGPVLPPLPAQYSDYVHWQRERLAPARISALQAAWRERLQGIEPIRLNQGTPNASESTRSGVCRITIGRETLVLLRTVMRDHGATLAVTLLAVFATLLEHLTGQSDLAIGVPVSDRERSIFEPLIGLFVNVVIVRLRVKPAASFGERLALVREAFYDACRDKDLPYALVPCSEAARVWFSCAPFVPGMDLELPGVASEPVRPVGSRPSRADLSLHVQDRGTEIACGFLYKSDLLTPEYVANAAAQFQRLLTTSLRAPHDPIVTRPRPPGGA